MSFYWILAMVNQIFNVWKACWFSCVFIVNFFCLSHFSIGCRSICWMCGSIHCVHSLVTESPWTMCGSIHQDRYHLTPTLRNFFVKSFLQLHKFVPSPRALERCVDRSTKIDTTYAFVSNSIFALIWFNFFGLMNQGYFRNFFYIY